MLEIHCVIGANSDKLLVVHRLDLRATKTFVNVSQFLSLVESNLSLHLV